ncbi:hypothetical protein SH1V18_33230 [Vallitalea longa]|uniref:Uncharacterized protein n=1 Tax=Vallitalea longa TaxID=2936439 RepID=A0A9W6DGW0_9FIRM|nr:hypothetical protein [Vallitalea longa]GKX30843.1 hypothetical protein SH1V18_33230 [Vallitalea longa]
MEAIINKIISIENKAREVLDTTNEEKDNKNKEMNRRIDELKDKILHDANRKVKQLRQRELDEAQAEADENIKKAQSKLEKMKQYGDEKREMWSDELVKAVLER